MSRDTLSYQRGKMKERYHRRRMALCVKCGGKPAEGRARCLVCLEKDAQAARDLRARK